MGRHAAKVGVGYNIWYWFAFGEDILNRFLRSLRSVGMTIGSLRSEFY
jgi:hypothetical protein